MDVPDSLFIVHLILMNAIVHLTQGLGGTILLPLQYRVKCGILKFIKTSLNIPKAGKGTLILFIIFYLLIP